MMLGCDLQQETENSNQAVSTKIDDGLKTAEIDNFTKTTSLAKSGDASAQTKLGLMYFMGQGVAQDYKQALEWFRKAAVQGDAFAQFILGLMYENGEGIEKDKVLAYMLYNLSAANGLDMGAENRNLIMKEMSLEQIEEGQQLSANWKPGTPLPEKSKTGVSR